MHYFLDKALTEKYNRMLRTHDTRVVSGITPLHTIEEQIQLLRKADLQNLDACRADQDLKGMPVLLVRQGNGNRVLVQNLDGDYADVTEGTAMDISRLSMGLVVRPIDRHPTFQRMSEAFSSIFEAPQLRF